MSKTELLARIRSERAALEAVLATLTPDQLALPATLGAWSVKDALAHLAVWTARVITLLYEAERGLTPSYPSAGGDPNWTRLNARDQAEQQDRPLDRVLADFRATHKQLLKRIEAWPDEAALTDAAVRNLRGKALADVIWSDSGAHDAEHRAQIEAWLRATGG